MIVVSFLVYLIDVSDWSVSFFLGWSLVGSLFGHLFGWSLFGGLLGRFLGWSLLGGLLGGGSFGQRRDLRRQWGAS